MAKNYSIYDIGDRDHFGIFGFSYTSSMVMKYVMPFCLDLFSWFGACSVFYYAFGPSIQALEEEIEKYAVNYLYVTYGDKDDARDQTRDAYREFITGVPKLGDRSELIITLVSENNTVGKMKIAIGADHGGFELKKSVIASFADAEFVDRLVDAVINNDVSILLDLEGYSRSDDGDGVES